MNLAATLALNASNFQHGIGEARQSLGGFKDGLRSMLGPLAGMTAGLLSLGTAAKLMLSSIRDAAAMEDFETSFVTLLGSVDAAQARMATLSKFAADTPFEMPEIARASRTLETLTRGALSTGAGLTMVGDVAAATQQPFGELAVVIGRLYDGLQSGRPVGEAMMRLQELGVISGDVRGRIEALQAEGARGAEVWGIAAEAFNRFAGEMDRKSQTLNGRVSSLSDAWKGLSREVGGPFMEVAKGEVTKMTYLLEEFASQLREVKTYWSEFMGVVNGQSAGGLEAVAPLIARAKALQTLAEKEQLVADIQQTVATLQEQMAEAPTLDFSQSITQAERLLGFVQQLPDAALRAADAQRTAAERLATIAEKSPEYNTSIDAAAREMQNLLDRQRLRDPSADPIDRQISAIVLGQRATEGVLAEPPQNLEQAKEQLELEMELVENMRKHPELIELAAQKAAGIADAYREILALQSEVRSVVGLALRDSVGQVIDEIHGAADEGRSQGGMGDSLRSLAAMTSDRLAKIGGFIGGAGGPAVDYARRTAAASEQSLGKLDKILASMSRPFAEPAPTRWA